MIILIAVILFLILAVLVFGDSARILIILGVRGIIKTVVLGLIIFAFVSTIFFVFWYTKSTEPHEPNTLIPITAGCIQTAAIAFGHSENAMYTLLKAEGGAVGEISYERDNTMGIGAYKINERFLPIFEKVLHQNRTETIKRLRNDGCFNALAAGYLLKIKVLDSNGNYLDAMSKFNSDDPIENELFQRTLIQINEENQRSSKQHDTKK